MKTESTPTRRARNELSEAWEHLVAAAEQGAKQGAKQVSRGGRPTKDDARERAALAGLALRAQRRSTPWRWMMIGMGAGMIVGMGIATAWCRRQHLAEPAESEQLGRAEEETEQVRIG